MSQLGRDPEIIKLARDLGLPISGDCLARVRDYALRKARQLLDGFDPKSMHELQRVLANRLLVRIAVIDTDDDIDGIADEYREFSPTLVRQYLTQHIVHELGDREYEGMALFLEYAREVASRKSTV